MSRARHPKGRAAPILGPPACGSAVRDLSLLSRTPLTLVNYGPQHRGEDPLTALGLWVASQLVQGSCVLCAPGVDLGCMGAWTPAGKHPAPDLGSARPVSAPGCQDWVLPLSHGNLHSGGCRASFLCSYHAAFPPYHSKLARGPDSSLALLPVSPS